jgi:hypothetical protein
MLSSSCGLIRASIDHLWLENSIGLDQSSFGILVDLRTVLKRFAEPSEPGHRHVRVLTVAASCTPT